jgi:hypothetical protein
MIRISIKLIFLIFAAFFLFAGQAKADVGSTDIKHESAEQQIYKIYTEEQQPVYLHWPVMTEGRDIMVPAPDLAVALKAGFRYFQGNGRVEFSRQNKKVTIKVDPEPAGGAFCSPEGVVYVPLTPVISGLGGAVSRSVESGEANILFKQKQNDTMAPAFPMVNALEDMLPPGCQLTNEYAAGVAADVDGDGLTEKFLNYKTITGSAGVMVYREMDEKFQKVWQVAGDGEIRDVIVTDLNGGGAELLICRQDAEYFGLVVNVYSWQEGLPGLIFANSSSSIETGDFDGDGTNEFALWSEDMKGTYAIEVYKWDGEGFSHNETYPDYFKKVAQYYNEQLIKQPGNKAIIYYLADALLRSGDTRTALDLASRGAGIIDSYPTWQHFQRLRGDAMFRDGSFKEAADAYQRALSGAAEQSMWPGALYNQALCYKNMGNDSLAFTKISAALSQGNDWPAFSRALETLTEWQGENSQNSTSVD